MAGIVGAQFFPSAYLIRTMDKILSVKEFCLHVFHALFNIGTANGCKFTVVHFHCHGLSCLHCSNAQSHQPGNLSVPHSIQCIFNWGIFHAILIPVLPDDPLGCLLNLFPVIVEKGIIRAHLVLPVKTEDGACLSVYSRALHHFSAVPDHAIRLK